MSELPEEYKEYTFGLALLDAVPVLLFLGSGLIMYSMYARPLLLAGVLASVAGGMSKVIWKMIVVIRKKDLPGLTRAFHILMPAGFALMILSVAAGGGRSEEHTSELQSPDNISYAVFCLKKIFF